MNKLNLPVQEWLNLLLHALYAGAGAALTYLIQNISGADFGTLAPAVVAVLTVLAAYLHKVYQAPNTPPGPNAPMA